MKKTYYSVSIIDRKSQTNFPVLCEMVAKIDTKSYSRNYIFRETTTGKIILPDYDQTCSLTYDNSNNRSYYKISHKKALDLLKSISINPQDYLSRLHNIEKVKLKRILSL